MKNKWMAMLVGVGLWSSVMFAQPYPQDPRYQGEPAYSQYDNDGYNDSYYDDDPGVYAPAPPQVPRYAYSRPPMPGPGYVWADGYWNFFGGRYVWVSGYWMLPPYAGAYWVRPRYVGGRFFRGFWGGGPARAYRGYGHNGYNYQRRVQPSPYRGGSNHNSRHGNDYRGGRR